MLHFFLALSFWQEYLLIRSFEQFLTLMSKTTMMEKWPVFYTDAIVHFGK